MNHHFFHRSMCLLAAVILSASFGACRASPKAAAYPIITEAANSNRTVLADADGQYHDWIEIYNPNQQAMSLEGYTLSDSDKSPRKWEFPKEISIPAGGYLVVFCSGKQDHADRELHTSFRISKDGEPILLCDPAGRIVSRLDVPQLNEDISIGRDPSEPEALLYYGKPTPGLPNGDDGVSELLPEPIPQYDLRITEYTTSNNFNFYDRDGDCPSWAEIYNYGTQPVNLSGLLLSDDPYNLNKWEFPEGVVLEPGAYQLVLFSGKNKWSSGELHTDFRLTGKDPCIILSDAQERTIDRVELQPLSDNVSCGLLPGDDPVWVYFARPTPGAENNAEFFSALSAASALSPRKVWISEVMAVSGKVSQWQEDWIELYNGSGQPVDLSGWSLSDSSENLRKYTFSDAVVQPGEYLLLQADGTELPFQLSAAGETLYLTRPDGTLCDRFETGRQMEGVSSGRPSGGENIRCFFPEPTPAAPNGSGFPGYTALPRFSREDIYLSAGETVTLTGPGEIRYTLDGSEPDLTSAVYDGPIPIQENTIIRAACFEPNRICGGVASHTYLTDVPHDIDVVCLSTAPENFFDPYTGIYEYGPSYDPEFPYVGANFWQDWERPVHFEFYSTEGSPRTAFDAGVRIFGQYSRAIPQKSMSIHLREAYGPSEVRYPFFENNDVTQYDSLLLRTSGQDWSMSKLRDALTYQVVKEPMDLDGMDYRPAALYLNGEYWGLYNIRDKVNESYLATHRGVDPDNVDIIKGEARSLAGDTEAYEEMLQYLRTHSLTDPDNFAYIESIVDVDEVLDYWITEIFFANTDTGNIKIYRERTPGSRWRLILFDLDWSLFYTTYQWDMLLEATDPEGHGIGNNFSTLLLRSLLDNEGCREKFIERYAYHMNTTFAPERTAAILHEMADAIRTEIPRQHERWGEPSVGSWEEEIAFLEQAMQRRRTKAMRDLQLHFSLSDARLQELFPDA